MPSVETIKAALCAALLAACSSSTPTPATTTTPEPAADAATPSDTSGATDASIGTIKTIYVNSARVDCTGEVPRKCLQTRATPDAAWELFYAPIAGFTYEEGHSYELRVEVTQVDHPPADGSSLRYRLVEIVAKH